MTDTSKNIDNFKEGEIIKELLEVISNPIHRRLVNAYKGDEPLASMETELAEILLEIWRGEDEDQKS
jgi:hypothetical protein